MGAKVVCHLPDPFREHRYLQLGGTCVRLVGAVFLNNPLLNFCVYHYQTRTLPFIMASLSLSQTGYHVPTK